MSKKKKTNINNITEEQKAYAEDNKELSPKEYFDIIKGKRNTITEAELQSIADNCIKLANKYLITGQKDGLHKICFIFNNLKNEKKLLDMGINTFIYKDDIDEYIDYTRNDTLKVIKLIELEKYPREIPDEIVTTISKVKDIFDQLYIVYTDYTRKEERKIEAKKRDRDPIIFGTFQDRLNRICVDRFYYLGDWEDEYCDLTLDKMISTLKKEKNINIERTIKTPKDMDQLVLYINNIDTGDKLSNFKVKPDNEYVHKIKSKFKNIKTFLIRRKKV